MLLMTLAGGGSFDYLPQLSNVVERRIGSDKAHQECFSKMVHLALFDCAYT
jgi:hypothetical protein